MLAEFSFVSIEGACEESGVLFSNPSLRGVERRSNPGPRGTAHAVRWIAPAFAGAGFRLRLAMTGWKIDFFTSSKAGTHRDAPLAWANGFQPSSV
jgi:hypothetical protein